MEVASSKILNERPEVASSSRPLLVGIITGQIAGLIMAVIIMIVFTLFLGKGPLYPVQVIGSVLLGETALNGFNALALVVGLILHQLGPSLLWGVAFGLVAQRFPITSIRQSLLIGLLRPHHSLSVPFR
ncbi:MAG: hypothetical protein EOP05_00045 [Proteobacteria bacterium]|nr:MAG: hypothetical protein EOP05_00045 [Pseudomonadota bacterium]